MTLINWEQNIVTSNIQPSNGHEQPWAYSMQNHYGGRGNTIVTLV